MPDLSTKYFTDERVREVIELLESGSTLIAISEREGFPSVPTIIRWEAGSAGDELADSITRARDIGYAVMSEKAVADAKACDDPAKGRLAFDADRWHLSHMRPKVWGAAATLKHADANGEKMKLDEVSALTRLAALATVLVRRADDPDNTE